MVRRRRGEADAVSDRTEDGRPLCCGNHFVASNDYATIAHSTRGALLRINFALATGRDDGKWVGREACLSNASIRQRVAYAAKRLPWSPRLVFLLLASITVLLAMSGVATWNLRVQRIEAEWVLHSEQVR